MLVLNRCVNETITITVGGVEISVKVCRVKGEQVRLGFTAPRDVHIRRNELEPYRPGAIVDETA